MSIFNVFSDEQDVESLLNNVNEALQQWESGKRLPLDLTIMLGDAGKVNQRISRLKGLWNVDSNAVILSNRPGLGPWIIRFQRIIRRLTFWFTEPIMQQVRLFQRETAVTLTDLFQLNEQLLAHSQEQAEQIATLQAKIAKLEALLENNGNKKSHAKGQRGKEEKP